MAIRTYLNRKTFGDCKIDFNYIENEEVTFKIFMGFSPLLDSNRKQVEVTYFFEPMGILSDRERVECYNRRIEKLITEAFDKYVDENLVLPVKNAWVLLESDRYKVQVDLKLTVSCNFN